MASKVLAVLEGLASGEPDDEQDSVFMDELECVWLVLMCARRPGRVGRAECVRNVYERRAHEQAARHLHKTSSWCPRITVNI